MPCSLFKLPVDWISIIPTDINMIPMAITLITMLFFVPLLALAIIPQTTSMMELEIEQSGGGNITGSVSELELFIYIPQTDAAQTSDIIETIIKDAEKYIQKVSAYVK